MSREIRPDASEQDLINSLYLHTLSPQIDVVDEILSTNCNTPSLQSLRKQATSIDSGPLTLERGVLLYNDRLIVPDTDNLRILLIREAHDQISTAHPSANKTMMMLSNRYFSKGI